KTVNIEEECRNADIIVACCGVAKMITEKFVKPGQIVIDVGMNVDEEGRLCGDVDYEKVSEIADAVTPVPGGVGSITTAILLKHVVDNAGRQV
ncbi:MAG: bifunctional 5,10-methylene-tetrahydrofolate dehydrogenase/5,10-methylene-tetrahydrofolate cyclohydrolase, partial [Clostridiales bacterium]|nr:bifunctional 5,10-methylene-tetrahydrofolate dehydrogenase/5,10-methylene-tetrahydrofolate cyclohydrolase [Clostridiales bacterium]